jgi:hypothetical protein
MPPPLMFEKQRHITDSDVGVYEVMTVTSMYFLDLDQRRFTRVVRESFSPSEPGPLSRFETDESWVPLVELMTCVRGGQMTLTGLPRGEPHRWTTTRVLAINCCQQYSSA